MIRLKAYKYRLKPRAEQITQFDQHFGHVRFVKNWAIALKGRYYRRFGKGLSSRCLQDQLVKKKKLARYQWLSDINSQALLAALMDVESAFKKFFGGAGYPKFKRKYAAWQSFQAPQHVEATKNKIKLPKIGWVHCVMHRDLPEGKIKTCTIKRAPSGKYSISILVEQQVNEVMPCAVETDKTIGIDVGIKTFATCSDETEIKNPRLLDRQLVSLKQEQQVFSRMKKGSKNRSKQKMVVAKLHEKVANARHDFIHKSSYAVAVKNHATTFVIEDLQIGNMIRNPKLARHIANCGWGMWATALAYKLAENGKNLIRISPFAPSSKECRMCHNKHASLKLSDRVFVCPVCNHTEDRDLHASHNIKRFGLQKEFEAAGSVVTVKRSPSSKRVKARRDAKSSEAILSAGQSKPPLERLSV